MDDHQDVLAEVGPRLRALRQEGEMTLSELSGATGISVSTLSRLEAGQRKPTLELLLPLARAHQIPLDDLVGATTEGDPRIRQQAVRRGGLVMVPLTRRPGGLQAYKITIPGGARRRTPEPQVHEGYDWLYVLSGRLRMVLAEHDLVLGPGEAAEFDTRVPHWFGCAERRAVEVLVLFGPQGERVHLRAKP